MWLAISKYIKMAVANPREYQGIGSFKLFYNSNDASTW